MKLITYVQGYPVHLTNNANCVGVAAERIARKGKG